MKENLKTIITGILLIVGAVILFASFTVGMILAPIYILTMNYILNARKKYKIEEKSTDGEITIYAGAYFWGILIYIFIAAMTLITATIL